VTDRSWAETTDGIRIPITLVHLSDLQLPAPTLLYGYGAYESVLDPDFDPAVFPLLDRGCVYAIAHVRGGGEMGRLWHLDGRMEKKINTFNDFIAAAEHLMASGVSEPGRIAARGISAGGLLMGAVTVMRPDLWAAIVAEVPFVDVINTMVDPAIPLTVAEWEEWGNPDLRDNYEYMSAYSPYDNTVARSYPAILATAGFNDPRVAYWEPAKWVAKLRAVNEGTRPILLRTELGSGHSGRSGRYDHWKDEAFILAFVLDQLGLA
jgi:oligopeptidase B